MPLAEMPGIREHLNQEFKMKIVAFVNRMILADFSKNLQFMKTIILSQITV